MAYRCGRRPLLPLNDSTNSPSKLRKASALDASLGKSPSIRRSSRICERMTVAAKKRAADSIGQRLRSASVKPPAAAGDGSPTRRRPGRPFGSLKRVKTRGRTFGSPKRIETRGRPLGSVKRVETRGRPFGSPKRVETRGRPLGSVKRKVAPSSDESIIVMERTEASPKRTSVGTSPKRISVDPSLEKSENRSKLAVRRSKTRSSTKASEPKAATAGKTMKTRRPLSCRQAKELAVCRMFQRNFKLSVNSMIVDRWSNGELFGNDKGLPYVHLAPGDVLTKRKDDSPDSAYSSGVASSLSRSSRGTDGGTPPLATHSADDGEAPTTATGGVGKRLQQAGSSSRISKRTPSTKRAKLEGAKRGVSYQGIRRMEYKDLFCEILPFVKPTYTPLCDPPMPHLIGVDTSKRWLCNLSESKLNEFVDVGTHEKEFFGLWNAFTMRRENRPVGCAGLPFMLERFMNEFGAVLVQRKLLFNFISHCSCLCRSGFLSQSQMFAAMELIEPLKFEPFIVSRAAEPRRSPQRRSPSKNKIVKSLSNFFRLS